MKRLLILPILIMMGNNLLAQSIIQANINQYLKAPELTALGKFGDVPVNLYNGTMGVSVPIYVIKSKDLQIPISADYHSGGIRVDEEAGRTGLGWNLSCGGAIYRKINGKDDLYYNSSSTSAYYLDPASPDFSDDSPTSSFFSGNTISTAKKGNINFEQAGYLESGKDFQPDDFNFSLPGLSGKFILSKQGEVIKQTRDNTKIELVKDPQNRMNTSWLITSGDGTRYYFNDAETIRPVSGSLEEYISAWYLTKIVSVTGNQISFVYQTEIVDMVPSVSGFFEQQESFVYGLDNDGSECSSAFNSITGVPYQKYTNRLLTEITFNNGKLLFSYSSRIDCKDQKKLDKITLADKSGVSLKEFVFNYDYFSANNLGYLHPAIQNNDLNQQASLDGSYYNKRLKLFSFVTRAGDIDETTRFFYNENNLPPKYHLGRDHWGFFNGAQNTSLLPPFTGQLNSGQVVSYPGADREPDQDAMQAFSLIKIQYPSGGYSSFEYEGNDYILQQAQGGEEYRIQQGSVSYYPPAEGNQTKRIVINIPQTAVLNGGTTNVTLDISALRTSNDPAGSANKTGYYKVIQQSNNSVRADQNLSNSNNYTITAGSSYATFSKVYALQPGVYYLDIYLDKTVDWIRNLEIKYRYTFKETSATISSITRPAGGLRIKKVTEVDPLMNVSTERNYSYGSTVGGKFYSYGRLMSRPIYTDYIRTLISPKTGELVATRSCEHFIRSASSNSEINSGSGVIVGYDTVIVVSGQGNLTGKTVNIFYNTPDVIPSFYRNKFPSGIKNRYAPLNGILKKSEDHAFNSVSNSFSVKRETEYFWNSQLSNNFGLFTREVKTASTLDPHNWTYEFFFYTANSSSWIRQDSIVEKLYNYNGTVINRQAFKYEAVPGNYQVKQKIASASKTKSSTAEEYFYSTDFAAFPGDPKYKLATLLNLKDAPIERIEKIIKNNTEYVTGGEISEYILKDEASQPKAFVSSAKMLLTESPITRTSFSPYNSSNTPSSLYSNKYLYSYNSKYELSDIISNDLQKTSYVWSYNSELPVAEIKGAASNEVLLANFEEGNNFSANAVLDVSKNHTGKYSVKINSSGSNEIAAINTVWMGVTLSKPKKFTYSGWVYSDGPATELTLLMKRNGETANFTYKDVTTNTVNGQWVYLKKDFDVPADVTLINISISNKSSGSAWFDDLRIYPAQASITSYTYEPLIGVKNSIDDTGKTTSYDYDNFQRLKSIKDQDGNITKHFMYHYKP